MESELAAKQTDTTMESETVPTSPPTMAKFLDLPRELRDVIYKLTLRIKEVTDDGSNVPMSEGPCVIVRNAQVAQLMYVNRQIHDEYMEIVREAGPSVQLFDMGMYDPARLPELFYFVKPGDSANPDEDSSDDSDVSMDSLDSDKGSHFADDDQDTMEDSQGSVSGQSMEKIRKPVSNWLRTRPRWRHEQDPKRRQESARNWIKNLRHWTITHAWDPWFHCGVEFAIERGGDKERKCRIGKQQLLIS